jgi:dimeric dUTPase (all-alpha-NTP-PPase superfamily)
MSDNRFKEHLTLMLDLQDSLNSKIDIEWRMKNFPYSRAAVAELSEAMDHYGWAWWKVQHPDIPQFEMEIVDVWHFILAGIHQHYFNNSSLQIMPFNMFVADLFSGIEKRTVESDILTAVERLMSKLLTYHLADPRPAVSQLRSVLQSFYDLLELSSLSTDELFERYIGKNLLNEFRRAHGYKEGTYIKNWNGREDNEYLHDLLVSNNQITVSNYNEIKSEILVELESIYTQL